MDTDIRKPDTGTVTIDRPHQPSNSNTDSTTSPDAHSPLIEHQYTEPVSEGEEDEDMAIGIAMNEVGSARVPLGEALKAIAYREQQRQAELERQRQRHRNISEEDDEIDERTPFLQQRRTSVPAPVQRLSIHPLMPASEFDKSLQKKLKNVALPNGEESDEDPNTADLSLPTLQETIYTRAFSAAPGKRIAVPVRVEPKVFFAQERTFLVRSLSLDDICLTLICRNGCTLVFSLLQLQQPF